MLTIWQPSQGKKQLSKKKLTKYHKKFGFIENVVFCKCQNLKEDILFLKILNCKVFGNKI
jgi:hypothetical protein